MTVSRRIGVVQVFLTLTAFFPFAFALLRTRIVPQMQT
jgi:hypothetical protein